MSNATDYKSTLNLANTDFAMKAQLATRELQWLEAWQKDSLYQQIRRSRSGAPKYILHDGPPYANGQIHLGHAVNKVLKDMIVKSKTLSGFDAPFVPGWDCHGLPIELKVEAKVGKVGDKVDANQFRAACRDYAASQVQLQKQDFERLGVLADWDNPYLTMNFKQEADTVRALASLFKKQVVNQGFKPVNWCLDCRSALAEAEVEYEDKTSDAIDVGFKVAAPSNLGASMQCDAVIWTTTPWTLPANEAVSVHPELEYSLVRVSKDRALLLASSLVEDTLKRYELEAGPVLSTFKGSELEGLELEHPLIEGKKVPVILGTHVSADSGTGLVHTAPGHGADDFEVAKGYNLPVTNPVGANGVYLEDSPLYANQHIYKANPQIIEALKANNQLLHHAKFEHSYPHCWRHKTPIIFRATPQWFVRMDQSDSLREACLKDILQVTWTPEWGQNRITAMLENRPDWCISRQRTWGVPIAVFTHIQTGKPHPRTAELLEEVATRIEADGIEAWFDLQPAELLGEEAKDYEKCPDTLDVWFDSGVTHTAVLEGKLGLEPVADLYLEGSDQHRGWFQTSLISSEAMHGRAPFKQVLTHGFVVDEAGFKMSKSKGNIITPQEVINKSGADILRLWIASSDYRYEMAAGEKVFAGAQDAYRRIRNTLRFLLANLNGFEPSQSVKDTELIDLDAYILARATEVQTQLIQSYEAMEFHSAVRLITDFCSQDLGGFYLDIIKDRQYTGQTNGLPRRSAQTTLYELIQMMVRWIAPVLSFTAQEIWPLIPAQDTPYVFTSEWYTPQLSGNSSISFEDWQLIVDAKSVVNKALDQARANKQVAGSLSASVVVKANEPTFSALNKLGSELRFVLITSSASLQPADQLEVEVSSAVGTKCARCWHVLEDVGTHANHPELCGRCISNIEGQGETRSHA